MKTTVYEDRLARAGKDKKGDDKKGERARKISSLFIYYIAYFCCVTYLPCIQNWIV